MTYDQTFIEASNANGETKRFFYRPQSADALKAANAYAQSDCGYGYVVLMGRNRLNDYVGAPIWSKPEVIKEL